MHALVTNESVSVSQASPDIVRLEPRISLENRVDRIAGREHSENVLNGQAPAANDRLAAEDPRIGGYSREQLSVVHGLIVPESETVSICVADGDCDGLKDVVDNCPAIFKT